MPNALRQFLVKHPRLVRRAANLIPDIEWTKTVRPIGPMRLRLRLNKGLWVRNPLITERHQLGVIHSWIRPGDTVYDIGANIGYVLRFMVGICGAGRGFAFEPVPFNRALLEKNIKLGGLEQRVKVFPCAVGDRDGEVEFTLDEYTGATGRIDSVREDGASWQDRWGIEARKVKVPLVSIDNLMARGEIAAPRMMKIDVEGAEEFVIAGARRTLEEHKPRLVMELHTLEEARRTMRLLDGLGYALFGQVDIEGQAPRRRYDAAAIEAAKERPDLPFHLYATPDAAELEREIPPYGG